MATKSNYTDELQSVITEFSCLNLDETFFTSLVDEAYRQFREEKESKNMATLASTFRRLIDQAVIARIRNGNNQLKEKYILKNIPLILDVKQKKDHYTVLSDDEAISTGTIALYKALDNYDPSKNCTFATYAVGKIIDHLAKEIREQNNAIGTAPNTTKTAQIIDKIEDDLYSKLGRKPTDEEIAKIVKVTAGTVKRYRMFNHTVSFQDNIGNNQDLPLASAVSMSNETPMEKEVELYQLRDTLQDYLKRLSARQRHVINMRFGLLDGNPKTLQQLGDELGISGEMVRLIEEQGLRKLRTPQKKRKLQPYIID